MSGRLDLSPSIWNMLSVVYGKYDMDATGWRHINHVSRGRWRRRWPGSSRLRGQLQGRSRRNGKRVRRRRSRIQQQRDRRNLGHHHCRIWGRPERRGRNLEHRSRGHNDRERDGWSNRFTHWFGCRHRNDIDILGSFGNIRCRRWRLAQCRRYECRRWRQQQHR